MRFLILIVLSICFNPANAQLDEAERIKIDSAIGELCDCFTTVLSSFDPKFQQAFLLSIDDNDKGKALMKEYFLSLDSAQKYSFKQALEVKIVNPDSEFTKCGKALIDKYQVSAVASDGVKKYMLDKLTTTDNCGLMSKMILQQISKKKQ